jgi:hypothetical protein
MGRPGLAPVTVTARSLGDYRNMFALEDADLMAGPVLDCPAGASSFGAEARACGARVVSVDPVYALSKDEIVGHVQANLGAAPRIFDNSDLPIDWGYLGSPRAYVRKSDAALRQFVADRVRHPRSYVCAALPQLPFADRSFRLTLSSHLLFIYRAAFSFRGHLASVLEMVRVSTSEVRIHPVVDATGAPYPRLTELRDALNDHAVATQIRPVTKTWIVGAAEMLVCYRR